MLCSHFSDTCIIAEQKGKVIGFISAYFPPEKDHTLFVWQVAVDGSLHGKGIASKMLKSLLQREKLSAIFNIETTVTPSNEKSRKFFYSISRDLNCLIEESDLFLSEHFGNSSHEKEILFKIGPFERTALG